MSTGIKWHSGELSSSGVQQSHGLWDETVQLHPTGERVSGLRPAILDSPDQHSKGFFWTKQVLECQVKGLTAHNEYITFT